MIPDCEIWNLEKFFFIFFNVFSPFFTKNISVPQIFPQKSFQFFFKFSIFFLEDGTGNDSSGRWRAFSTTFKTSSTKKHRVRGCQHSSEVVGEKGNRLMAVVVKCFTGKF